MNYTGERVVPNSMSPKSGILLEHLARYEFSKAYCKEKVLDIACGVGYGSEIVLRKNDRIRTYTGIDACPETIAYAKKIYPHPKVSYYVGDALDNNLHKKHGTFDTILSFETIEHFFGDRQFIENLFHLLTPTGTLIISTPFGKGKDQPCSSPYHVYQYTEEEFLEVLRPFSSIQMYHQVDDIIEVPQEDTKYYLMVAVCKK